MRTDAFYYDLPRELIAQTPLPERDSSRLMVYCRETGQVEDTVFSRLTDYLRPGDTLVRNTTRVLPARLLGTRKGTGGAMEFLLLRRVGGDDWEALVKPGRRAKIGAEFDINDELSVTVVGVAADGGRTVRLNYQGIFEQVLERAGHVPLPPYIVQELGDAERYQTVYARERGSAAAPTAGLHFTDPLMARIRDMGVDIVDVLLHVGLGTFRPVSAQTVEEHHMHAEYYEVSAEAARRINAARARNGRIIAVGTTSCRTLESAANEDGSIRPGAGWTDIFITPGYRFRATDALITNFHLPESTLLMLVSAFAQREGILSAYRHAVELGYRFFSFGDAMLIR